MSSDVVLGRSSSGDADFTRSGVSRFPNRDLGVPRFGCEVGVPLAEQKELGHNRWHPDIPPLHELDPGDEVILESPGYDDYQLHDVDDDDDIRTIDLTRTHPIAGPVYVNGAQPGDLLVVDVLDVQPLSGIGYSNILPGMGGPLASWFPRGFKTVWDLHGLFATSRQVPGVEIPAISHPGVIGVAPSHELLQIWNEREDPLIGDGQAGPREDAIATSVLRTLEGDEWARVAATAARTVPPRENGGNLDIKNLSRGSRVYFPVFVEGALFSCGDLHFAEGDGEITWNAIEMDGSTWIRFGLIKGGMAKYGVRNPMLRPSPVDPNFGTRYLSFTGLSARGREQKYLDTTMAAVDAVEQAIDYLGKFGYNAEQAYTIISVAPCEMHVGGIVDIPNSAVTLKIPVDIFDKDILPH
ncbi:acetamidase/formamidase family protein (plasmid) [Rhodococcus pyridinivorans]|uniref:acetamidase/formamidase family protein n=1 Tax=Rhodococcus TaxID=1827 RepID=UPI00200B4FA7|nr:MULTISPECIES: acetamidase/formamidase family protein [Rhodococcus]MDV6297273.1 acetamidase/formamidase family protein [Rhodococcus aetherivorans]UPW06916.1 acetamidase/formamidase family protein [Rhodococcus pyridinivorans]